MGLTDKNLYSYCDNNPVMRKDEGGMFWDTVFDAVSLCFSVADVINNPDDPWAWVDLAADVASLVIPFATGGGLAVKTAAKVDDAVDMVKAVDNTIDTFKVADNAIDAIDTGSDIYRSFENGTDTLKGIDNTIGSMKQKKAISDCVTSRKSGWTLGEPVDNLTRAGNEPSWSTVRQRFWKNEAFYNSGDYSASNL